MGIPDSEELLGNNNQAEDVLDAGYRLGKYEVTQGEWKQVMGNESRHGRGATQPGADFPETYVNWDDAVAYCRKLTEIERAAGKLAKNQEYRLPTEAEWEYACRAGTTTRFHFGDDRAQLANYAWWGGLFLDDGTAEQEKYAHRVGQKLPNAWGLYDMCGNVSEWCLDWYGAKLAGGLNPRGPDIGEQHVLRGGSWDGQSIFCMSGIRNQASTEGRHFGIGFRVVLASVNRSPLKSPGTAAGKSHPLTPSQGQIVDLLKMQPLAEPTSPVPTSPTSSDLPDTETLAPR